MLGFLRLHRGARHKKECQEIIEAVTQKAALRSFPPAVWSLYSAGAIQLIGLVLLLTWSVVWAQNQLNEKQQQLDDSKNQIQEIKRQTADQNKKIEAIESVKVLPYNFEQVCQMIRDKSGIADVLPEYQVTWQGEIKGSTENYLTIIPKEGDNCEARIYLEDKNKIKELGTDSKKVLVTGTIIEVIPGSGNPLFYIKKNPKVYPLK